MRVKSGIEPRGNDVQSTAGESAGLLLFFMRIYGYYQAMLMTRFQRKLQITIAFFLSLTAHVLISGNATAASEPVAEVNGIAISPEEVDKALAAQLTKLEEEIYDLRRQKIDALINDRLLAKEAAKRGISVPALIGAEVTSKVGLVTEQEIESFYQANRGQIKEDEDKAREEIRSYLQNQKLAKRRQEFIDSLRSDAKIVINLKPPPVIRVQVATEGSPFKGAAKAPVTIVEFTDFHCPFCRRALSTLTQLESRYDGKIKLVFRDFPIDQLHPASRKAHEASRCANEQGKFWAYHDKLFANAPKASIDDLKAYAKEVGLDVANFEACFSSGKYKAAVQRDIEEGRRLGVTGTPTFFIDGRMIVGAQPLESFARIIDDELARGSK